MMCKHDVSSAECQLASQALTENEGAWIEFLRLISRNMDPPPTLRGVQALRLGFNGILPR